MFRGFFDHVLDEKGRTSLPKDFRSIIAQSRQPAILTAKNGYLAIYLQDSFDSLLSQFEELQISSREKLLRLHAPHPLNLDKQGRILIPPTLRRHAGLDREIMSLGVTHHIEIWDRGRYTADIEGTVANYEILAGNRKDQRP